MKRSSIFWPLTLIAVGVVWILINMKIIPATNLWALMYLLPYLLMAMGIGLILRSQWRVAGMIVSALIVVGAVAAVIYAPRLGWATVPPWAGEHNVMGSVAGSGKMETVTRNVQDFQKVSINYPAKIVIIQGESESVKIEADDNLIPQLTTDVTGGTLYIRNKETDWGKRVNSSRTVKITITVKDLSRVDFSTAGDLSIDGLKTDAFEISLNGAGEVTLTNIEVKQLDCNLSGAGNIRAAGSADNVKVQIDGFGSFYGDNLNSLDANITINGAGSANLRAKNSLNAEINGAGSVGYYGAPNVNQHINGAGSVTQLGK